VGALGMRAARRFGVIAAAQELERLSGRRLVAGA
jgi:hypothetical protein